MSDPVGSAVRNEKLIARLVDDLAPVPRLWSPLVRAALWIGVVLAVACVMVLFADNSATMRRLLAAPDMWLAFVGSTLTALLAAVAVFQLSLPDRKSAWALAPIPALLLWIGASGAGCLRDWLVAGTHVADLNEAADCLVFMVFFSAPLSILLVLMLRRAHPLRPNLVCAVGGLAVAAATATLLDLFHPFDAAATDLLIHLLAVAVVVALNVKFGASFLRKDAEALSVAPAQ
jgi:hypothetical protein